MQMEQDKNQEQQANRNKWTTVNTSNTENTRQLGITESKDRGKVMGKIDPKTIEKAVKDKQKAVENGKIITK
jgi:hypothetical protein